MLQKIDDHRWLIPRTDHPGMRTDVLLFASERLLEAARRDRSLEQAAHVATLPGIVGRALAMPDVHQGYGFPIGGVAAMSLDDGVVTPGGVGFDINCGVRLLATSVDAADATPRMKQLVDQLYREVPAGTGVGGSAKITDAELARVLEGGARYVVERGYGTEADLDHTEEGGCLAGADASEVSVRARQRGVPQLGSLGSGNHFVEVQYVDELFDDDAAARMGVRAGQVMVLIHSGSRGLGHQVCTDHVDRCGEAMRRYGITVPDRQLACVPIGSPEGRSYLGAMAAAANFAWANRQVMAHAVRGAFQRVFGPATTLPQVWDVCHNIAKRERHLVDGVEREVLVHRKGATRAFPGQPVMIPGSMGTSSYLLVGQEGAMRKSFGSACHGAGRVMSRSGAKKNVTAKQVQKELAAQGILVRALTSDGLTEERPEAYKDIEEVVAVVDGAGLAGRVARLRPMGVIKG